jgi:hypothetical protein
LEEPDASIFRVEEYTKCGKEDGVVLRRRRNHKGVLGKPTGTGRTV